jgi:hypothetical protein
VQLTKDAAEVKIDSLYRKISFILGLPIIHYNRSRQEYHKINFQQVFSRFFERYAINKDRTHAIAVGLGISYNNYIQNLAITGTGSCLYILLLTEKQYLIKQVHTIVS